ncbi:hypothetical protein [Macrococcus equipercicus]|nr:hypothetical protein [Macrococcus equipercicus]
MRQIIKDWKARRELKREAIKLLKDAIRTGRPNPHLEEALRIIKK